MAFIRDLKIGQKFLLVALMALVMSAAPTGRMLWDRFGQLTANRDELAGVAPVGDVLKTIRLTQLHRGITGSWLAGNDSQQAAREGRAAELDKALDQMLASTSAYPGDLLGQRRQEVQDKWKALRQSVSAKSLDVPTSFAQHTALVALQMRLLTDIADRSGLILDPEAGGYFMIAAVVEALPKLTEQMGQLRATGAVYLKKATMSDGERARLKATLDQMNQFAGDTDRYFHYASLNDADLARQVAGPLEAAKAAIAEANKLVQTQLLEPTTLSAGSVEYFNAMTTAIDAQFKLVDASFATVKATLEGRVRNGEAGMVVWAGVVLAIGLLAALLMRSIVQTTTRTVASAQAAAEALARGDLDHRIDVQAQDEVGQMARTLGQAMAELATMVRDIKSTGEYVSTASAQIAAGNSDLSARTEQSAANLQQTASSMEELIATVRNNAQSAKEAARLAGQSSLVATQAGDLVGQVVNTMDEISASSGKIADIIGVIDGIAFQTNILALNAAVEAARAGEQGRGFAVVASEVRSLAQRSSGAAKEIRDLISSSVTTIKDGAEVVGQAQRTMSDVVTQAQQVSTLVGEIGVATAEQTHGIDSVNSAVSQLDHSTQQNAALVEQSAAAASSLREQAERLVQAVGRFRV